MKQLKEIILVRSGSLVVYDIKKILSDIVVQR